MPRKPKGDLAALRKEKEALRIERGFLIGKSFHDVYHKRLNHVLIILEGWRPQCSSSLSNETKCGIGPRNTLIPLFILVIEAAQGNFVISELMTKRGMRQVHS